jgi:hypothetical protein
MYNLETDEEERMQEIKNAAVPYNTVGLLDVRWKPLGGPNEEDEKKPVAEIYAEEVGNVEWNMQSNMLLIIVHICTQDLLGKPWTYRLEIVRAADLPVFCDLAYVQYDFFGETFTTEAVQQTTYSPVFEYSKVHHVPVVTQEFIKFLKQPFEMFIHVTQHVPPPSVRSHRLSLIFGSQ